MTYNMIKIITLLLVGAILVLTAGCINESGPYVSVGNSIQPQPYQPAQPPSQPYQTPVPCVEHCVIARQVSGDNMQERITCTCGGRICITSRQKTATSEQERTTCTGEE